MAKPILAVLDGTRTDPPPIWLMRQAGRFLPEYRALRAKVGTVLNLAYSPELAAEVTLQPVRRFGFDAAILFSDILVVPDAMNQKVSFIEGEGPRLEPLGGPEGLSRRVLQSIRGGNRPCRSDQTSAADRQDWRGRSPACPIELAASGARKATRAT